VFHHIFLTKSTGSPGYLSQKTKARGLTAGSEKRTTLPSFMARKPVAFLILAKRKGVKISRVAVDKRLIHGARSIG
jgi:hypothetical protein